MQAWTLTYADPMAPRIAADARSGRTNYHDDQTWQLWLGKPDEPAVALETRYGGRVGLARVLPMWTVGRRQIYEAQGYHQPPILTAFAPDLLRLRADLTLAIKLGIEFWTMESQAVGGRLTLHNTGKQAESVRLDLVIQAARENKALPMFFLTLDDGQMALQVGRLEAFAPVLMLEGGSSTASRAMLGRTLTLEPGAQAAVRWVLAALPTRDGSVMLAHKWLSDPDWDAHFAAIEERMAALPQVETGDAAWDAALAWSEQLALRSFLGATGSLPHPSFVTSRRTNQGYALGGLYAGGFNAAWGGQTVPDALLIAPLVAQAAPELAQGMVRNFLAVQRDDGWIDAKPGLDGQRANVLAPPLLATLAFTVYHYTDDKAFLGECFDGLLAFFRRWLKKDLDRDGDGLPEWSDPAQGAFADSPTLAQSRRWAQGVDITTLEAPDLAAYLVREAGTLLRAAQVLGRDEVAAELAPIQQRLIDHLNAMWDAEAGAFHYRDRDTHACPKGEIVFEGKGDQPLRERTVLPLPGRLVLRVIGGVNYKPRLGCTLEGVDASGKGAHETLAADAFDWYRGMGAATTRTVWREIKTLKFDGLSRVYTIQASTLDLSRHDQSLFMPLWTTALDSAQAERMIAMLSDPATYGRAYGVPGCPADDPAYDAAHQNGCGGVWPRWNMLIAWALLDRGYIREAAELFRRLLAAQIRTLTTEHAFRALYNPDTGEGLGDTDVLSGAVAWGWFGRLFGAYVWGPGRVMISGPFGLEGESIAWTQHGVRVERSEKGTRIHFPSGHEVKLKPAAEPQWVNDPKAKPAPRKPKRAPASAPPQLPPPPVQRAEHVKPDDDLLPEVD